jgi:hypothetical protein
MQFYTMFDFFFFCLVFLGLASLEFAATLKFRERGGFPSFFRCVVFVCVKSLFYCRKDNSRVSQCLSQVVLLCLVRRGNKRQGRERVILISFFFLKKEGHLLRAIGLSPDVSVLSCSGRSRCLRSVAGYLLI